MRARDQVEHWLPRTAGWAWSHTVMDTIFGNRKPVNVNAEIIVFDQSSNTAPLDLGLGKPTSSLDEGRLSVWFLSTNGTAELRHRLAIASPGQTYQCRITTADGIAATLFMGESLVLNGVTNQVGVAETYLPLVDTKHVELFASGYICEAATNLSPWGTQIGIRTNGEFAARIQIPLQRGVFLLQRHQKAGVVTSTGLMLDPL